MTRSWGAVAIFFFFGCRAEPADEGPPRLAIARLAPVVAALAAFSSRSEVEMNPPSALDQLDRARYLECAPVVYQRRDPATSAWCPAILEAARHVPRDMAMLIDVNEGVWYAREGRMFSEGTRSQARRCARPELGPYHPTWRSNQFAIYYDKFEVTVAQYRACVRAGRCTPPTTENPERYGWIFAEESTRDLRCTSEKPGSEKHPITCVTANQAQEYCKWRKKRLPWRNEFKWAVHPWKSADYEEEFSRDDKDFDEDGYEYERSDKRQPFGQAAFPWGDAPPSCHFANVTAATADAEEGCNFGETWPVGTRPEGATPEGVHDLVGNVAEWAGHSYSRTYDAYPLGNSYRKHEGPRLDGEMWSQDVGFRCVQTIPGLESCADGPRPPDDPSVTWDGRRAGGDGAFAM